MSQFLKENDELSQALLDLVAYYRAEGRDRLLSFRSLASSARGVDFCGMGTSGFTPHAVEWQLAALGISARIVDAGELLHYGYDSVSGGQLRVFTSQSGESVEFKKLLRNPEFAAGYVAVTNSESSTLARGSKLTLPLCAGDEHSITTKTFTNNLALLHLLTTVLRDSDRVDHALSELEETAEALTRVDHEAIARAAEVLSPGDAIAFVARGPAVANAKQAALTFMEGARCLAAPFTGGNFNHGPFESVDDGFRLVVFAPCGATERVVESLVERAADNGARIVVLTDRDSLKVKSPDVVQVPVKRALSGESEHLFPIVAARSQNLLLYSLAASRGVEAGEFRYGGKVTARE